MTADSLCPFRFPFRAMASANEVALYSKDEVTARNVATAVMTEVRRIESKFSRYRDESVVSIINAAAGKAAVAVDDETAGLLNYAAAGYEQSDGLFDITSGVLRRVWRFERQTVPAQSDIDKLLPLIGWEKVEWNSPLFRLPAETMEIDFGGFGKEYAVDRAAALCEQMGIRHGMINLGGDIVVIGPHPDGRPWSIGIRDARNAHSVLGAVKVSRGAVATSGDYERYIDAGGRRYFHILDPRTGWPPPDSFRSVTVLAPSCLVAGTASTVAMVKGSRSGWDYLNDLELPCLIEDSKGNKRERTSSAYE